VDLNTFAEVPVELQTLFLDPGIIATDDLDADANEITAHMRAGTCMTCQATLGSSTVLIVNKKGIGAAYCGGACLQDMAVLGWLQEETSDIVDRVQFRGGHTDDAEK